MIPLCSFRLLWCYFCYYLAPGQSGHHLCVTIGHLLICCLAGVYSASCSLSYYIITCITNLIIIALLPHRCSLVWCSGVRTLVIAWSLRGFSKHEVLLVTIASGSWLEILVVSAVNCLILPWAEFSHFSSFPFSLLQCIILTSVYCFIPYLACDSALNQQPHIWIKMLLDLTGLHEEPCMQLQTNLMLFFCLVRAPWGSLDEGCRQAPEFCPGAGRQHRLPATRTGCGPGDRLALWLWLYQHYACSPLWSVWGQPFAQRGVKLSGSLSCCMFVVFAHCRVPALFVGVCTSVLSFKSDFSLLCCPKISPFFSLFHSEGSQPSCAHSKMMKVSVRSWLWISRCGTPWCT